ncbi:MAG: hypothetical protein GC201_01315 [Alphaproteobacteria bacterium]|nr:hypothetical protein [Alphaproteobacteria bacterium]
MSATTTYDIEAMARRLTELDDLEAIRDQQVRYGRALDWDDEALLAEVFWPDAEVDYGFFVGRGDEFVRVMMTITRESGCRPWHAISGQTVRLDGPAAADAECYFMGCSTRSDVTGDTEVQLIGGRYLDRFEKRDGAWRVARRTLICDFRYKDVAPTESAVGFAAQLYDHGRLSPAHPLYWHFSRR